MYLLVLSLLCVRVCGGEGKPNIATIRRCISKREKKIGCITFLVEKVNNFVLRHNRKIRKKKNRDNGRDQQYRWQCRKIPSQKQKAQKKKSAHIEYKCRAHAHHMYKRCRGDVIISLQALIGDTNNNVSFVLYVHQAFVMDVSGGCGGSSGSATKHPIRHRWSDKNVWNGAIFSCSSLEHLGAINFVPSFSWKLKSWNAI